MKLNSLLISQVFENQQFFILLHAIMFTYVAIFVTRGLVGLWKIVLRNKTAKPTAHYTVNLQFCILSYI